MSTWQSLAQSSLAAYSMAVDPNYQPGDHHLLLAGYLEAVERGEIKFLMIFMPPQHGKSEEASKKFVEWYLGKGSGKRKVAFATYSQEFADHWGKQVRDTMVTSDVYHQVFPGTVVDGRSKSRRRFDTKGGGWYTATSVGGGLTGKGPDLIVIDDPVKNYEEAVSETISERNWDWFKTVAKTRFPKAIVLIQTRWSGIDLAAKLLDEMKVGGDQWVIVKLEAVSTSPNDPLGRPQAPADPAKWENKHCLWPFKAKADDFRAIRKQVGSKVWQAMFQQSPTGDEGAIFKRAWFKRLPPGTDLHDLARSAEMVGQSWDLSFKKTKIGSYVVGIVMAKRQANFYVLDLYRERVDYTGTKKAMRWMTGRWPEARAIWVEDKANGPAIISDLSDTIPGMIPVEKDISKVAAWQAAAPYCEAGNVYVPDDQDAWWAEDFIEEMIRLEEGCQYDDQGDAFSQGIYKLKDYGTRAIIEFYKQEALLKKSKAREVIEIQGAR